ncbi:hypothetical protein QBC40DRAFT_300958 [Triangularia verruculosa]|uniref:Uncharacterized protein n=1 Tax=Triangularia verruculosa TaxID=2587418 RepID=A0AAN7AS90_9PEZI|nr:hypothetical protein QBC40DRAFT_300958 [Triangularia verruculosa]
MSLPTEITPLSDLTALMIGIATFIFCVSIVNSLIEDAAQPLDQASDESYRNFKDVSRDDASASSAIITFVSSLFIDIDTLQTRRRKRQDVNLESRGHIAHNSLVTIPPTSESPQLPYTARLIVTWKRRILTFILPKASKQSSPRRMSQATRSSSVANPPEIPTRKSSLGFEKRMKAVRPDKDNDTAMFRWAESCLDERVMLSDLAVLEGGEVRCRPAGNSKSKTRCRKGQSS